MKGDRSHSPLGHAGGEGTVARGVEVAGKRSSLALRGILPILTLLNSIMRKNLDFGELKIITVILHKLFYLFML